MPTDVRTSDDERSVVAVDLGTGGPKVALATTRGRIIDHESRTNDLILVGDDGVEQDPAQWWSTIVDAARAVLARHPDEASKVVALAVTSQWMGTVAVDAQGRHIGNALTWMDARGADLVARQVGSRLSIQGYDARKLRTWVQLTGGIPSLSGKDPVGHALWLRHERPEVHREAASLLEPVDYLNLRLTGRTAASFDTAVGWWATDNRDLASVRWDDRLVEWIGMDRSKLPELVPTGSVLGTLLPAVADELGLPSDVAVVTGTGDTASAAIGSGAVRDHDGHLYIGTSSWLSCHVADKKTDVLHNITTLPSGIPGRYWVATEQDTAGKCLTWLIESVLFPDDALLDGGTSAPDDVYVRIEELAGGVPAGSGGALFTPWLNGERTPVDDHTIRAGWHHLGLGTTRAQMVRSVLEGVAYNTRWMLDVTEGFTKRRFDSLTFVGGGARMSLWAQILADVLDRPIRRAAEPLLANVRGAALSAGVALGDVTWAEVPDLVPIAETFLPDASTRAVHDAHARHLQELYARTKGIHARWGLTARGARSLLPSRR